jgi:hypothetical protein
MIWLLKCVHLCIFFVLCSIIGATIISIGLYGVLWGKATEELQEDVGILESPSTENAPLLQSYRTYQTFEKKTGKLEI